MVIGGIYEGYFGKMLESMGGEGVPNNLTTLEFRKEVLNQYTDLSRKNPMEFNIKSNVGVYWISHISKWSFKCSTLKNGNIGALLIDLIDMPPEQQEWWKDHMIEENGE